MAAMGGYLSSMQTNTPGAPSSSSSWPSLNGASTNAPHHSPFFPNPTSQQGANRPSNRPSNRGGRHPVFVQGQSSSSSVIPVTATANGQPLQIPAFYGLPQASQPTPGNSFHTAQGLLNLSQLAPYTPAASPSTSATSNSSILSLARSTRIPSQTIPDGGRARTKEFTVEFCCLPFDIDKESPIFKEDYPSLQKIFTGDRLKAQIDYLRQENLTVELKVTTARSDLSLLPALSTGIIQHIIQSDKIIYPEIPVNYLELPQPPENDLERLFISLPFQWCRIGNMRSNSETLRISVDSSITHRSFTWASFRDKNRLALPHPNGQANHYVAFGCVKAALEIKGCPVALRDICPGVHHCFARHVGANLNIPRKRFNVPVPQDELQAWRDSYNTACTLECPQPPSGASGSHNSSEPMQNAQSTTAMAPPPTPSGPYVAPPYPSGPPRVYPRPSSFVQYSTIRRLAQAVMSVNRCITLTAGSVDRAVEILVSAVQGTKGDFEKAFNPNLDLQSDHTEVFQWSDNGGMLLEEDLSFRSIIAASSWFVSAGTTSDTIGDGVCRQVFTAALEKLSEGILEDLSLQEGYHTLKIAENPDLLSPSALDKCRVLGAFTAVFLLLTQAPPPLLSPALLQAAIGGVSSIVDEQWIKATHSPRLAEILALVSSDNSVPIPLDDRNLLSTDSQNLAARELRYLICGRIQNMTMTDFQQAPRHIARETLYINTLLGANKDRIESSPQFKAFRDGLALPLPFSHEELRSFSSVS
ncbi:hypothetical protein CVT24_000635 [Panaeolus cyanescens]|uniref:Uncharacterized protein n=1 Tax=Panaeolus cyanescens TaxID=181874 RepID=A0A409YT55_9AGAR|nr:hypothetical protein CVT24_000635 [Panaeolus cyanescens]